MKVSSKTLKQLSGINTPIEEIADLIENHIGAVDGVHNMAEDYKDIVVAEIVKKEDHPDADKLGIYQLQYGEKELIQVIAGDKRLRIGNKVAYIKPGAAVPISIYTETKPFIIGSRKMRGVRSNGMLGSEHELNLGTNQAEVMRLPSDAPVGESFAKYYQLDDLIIEVENKGLTNRGDLFGLIGLARELAAINKIKMETPKWITKPNLKIKPKGNCLNIEITNDAESVCKRYTAITMDNIEIKESPIEIKATLIKADIKPINNVVDITNYLSILLGQPLHAFDYDKLISQDPNSDEMAHINIRPAKDNENIHTLDDKVHDLSDRTIVIADSENPIAIAGIIGGKETEIDENTKRIVLECANFDKTNIRKSTMALGIFTDSSTKFKHAMSTDQCIPVLVRAVEMIQDLANGTVASKITDLQTDPERDNLITISIEKLNTHLGTNISSEDIIEILTNLGYTIEDTKEEYITVTTPTWRKDLEIAEDIHEDIGRIYGYSNIKLELPTKSIAPSQGNPIYDLKKTLRQTLVNIGCNELKTYNFTDIKTLQKSKQEVDLAYRVTNSLAPELALMRTSLLPSLLTKATENLQRGFNTFALFEFNIAHHRDVLDDNAIPFENWYLSFVLTSKANNEVEGSSYYQAKRYLEKTLGGIKIRNLRYELIAETKEQNLPIWIKNLIPLYNSNRSSFVYIQEKLIGILGEIDAEVRDNFKLPEFTCGFEISVNELESFEVLNTPYKETPKYPPVTKDLCFEMDKGIAFDNVETIIEKAINNASLWGVVEGLDIYQKSEKDTTKRITFRISIRHYKKTLTDKDVDSILKKIEKNVNKKFKSRLV